MKITIYGWSTRRDHQRTATSEQADRTDEADQNEGHHRHWHCPFVIHANDKGRRYRFSRRVGPVSIRL